jgi:hypothetical protein
VEFRFGSRVKGDFGIFKPRLCDESSDPLTPVGLPIICPRGACEFSSVYESVLLHPGTVFAFPDIVRLKHAKPLKEASHSILHFLVISGKNVTLNRVAWFSLFSSGNIVLSTRHTIFTVAAKELKGTDVGRVKSWKKSLM